MTTRPGPGTTTASHASTDGRVAAFEFLNGWADRIFVVSLRRATERRREVSAQLAGLRYEFLDAVDKLDLDRDRLAREGKYDERGTRPAYRLRREMPLGAIACALSHRRLYEDMVANEWERMLVLEDDVLPRVPEIAALPEALRELPPTWELCYLGYLHGEVVTTSQRLRQAAYVALAPLGLSRWRPREALRLLPRSFSPHLRRAGRHMCTHAYAVTREGARKLLDAQAPVALSADQLLTMLVLQGRIEAYSAVPGLFDQESVEQGPAYESFVRD